MDKMEARTLLEQELRKYRVKTYAELAQMVDSEPDCYEIAATSGKWYQLEVQAFWDGKLGGNVRIIGAMDDGGWRAFAPLSDSFIKTPEGTFVGE